MCIEEFLTIFNFPSNYAYLKALLFLSNLSNVQLLIFIFPREKKIPNVFFPKLDKIFFQFLDSGSGLAISVMNLSIPIFSTFWKIFYKICRRNILDENISTKYFRRKCISTKICWTKICWRNISGENDGRNILDREKIESAGIKYFGVGR